MAWQNRLVSKGATNGFEILLKTTDPALVQFELDVGWVAAAGHDPFALLKAHPGRFRQMLVKDVKAKTKPNFASQQDPADIGSGIIDWKHPPPPRRRQSAGSASKTHLSRPRLGRDRPWPIRGRVSMRTDAPRA